MMTEKDAYKVTAWVFYIVAIVITGYLFTVDSKLGWTITAIIVAFIGFNTEEQSERLNERKN